MPIRDVTEMLKWRLHVASERIHDLLEAFFRAFPIWNEAFSGELEKESIIIKKKSVSRDRHRLSSPDKPRGANRWSSGRTFLSHLLDGFL